MSKKLEIYHEFGKKIEEYLRPSTFPLAIKLIKSETEIPIKSRSPKSHLKLQNYLCQNFLMSRTYGWTIAVTAEDCACQLARAVLGWDPMTEKSNKLMHLFFVGRYAENLEISKTFEKHICVLKNKIIGLVISPLTRTKIEPDVVQIYCMPAQAMRLIQSYLYFQGENFEFTSAGRMASCHEGVVKTFLTDQPQLIILGNGDRVWGGAQDSELMFSIPKSKLELIINGLEASHKAGIKYPIPKYMNFTPGFQVGFAKNIQNEAGSTEDKDK